MNTVHNKLRHRNQVKKLYKKYLNQLASCELLRAFIIHGNKYKRNFFFGGGSNMRYSALDTMSHSGYLTILL